VLPSGLDGGVAGDDIWINGRRDAMVDAVVVQHSDGGHQTARLLGRVQQSAAGLVHAPETRLQQAEAALHHTTRLAVGAVVRHLSTTAHRVSQRCQQPRFQRVPRVACHSDSHCQCFTEPKNVPGDTNVLGK